LKGSSTIQMQTFHRSKLKAFHTSHFKKLAPSSLP
jgi:hypothetical protein